MFPISVAEKKAYYPGSGHSGKSDWAFNKPIVKGLGRSQTRVGQPTKDESWYARQGNATGKLEESVWHV